MYVCVVSISVGLVDWGMKTIQLLFKKQLSTVYTDTLYIHISSTPWCSIWPSVSFVYKKARNNHNEERDDRGLWGGGGGFFGVRTISTGGGGLFACYDGTEYR